MPGVPLLLVPGFSPEEDVPGVPLLLVPGFSPEEDVPGVPLLLVPGFPLEEDFTLLLDFTELELLTELLDFTLEEDSS